jgi:uncharacterized protein YndB with AHSA1/START domain
VKRDLHFEYVYPHTIERVWRALTDPAAIAQWLMQNDFEPTVGHKFQFHTKPGPGFSGIVNCEVLAVDAPNRLSYSWKGGALETVVTFTLESVPQGTRVRLEHTGFQGIKGWIVSRILGKGWKSNVLGKNLPAVLDYVDEAGFHPPADGRIPGCHRK